MIHLICITLGRNDAVSYLWAKDSGCPGTKSGVMGWTLRTPRHRYIDWWEANMEGKAPVFGRKVLAGELYENEKDPLERENLAEQPVYAKAKKNQQALFDRLFPDIPSREL
jgi:hypothetical protein